MRNRFKPTFWMPVAATVWPSGLVIVTSAVLNVVVSIVSLNQTST